MGLQVYVMHTDRAPRPPGQPRPADDLVHVQRVLALHGLPRHEEPGAPFEGTTEPVPYFPYGHLWQLRRALACLVGDRRLRTGPLTPEDRALIAEIGPRGPFHLIQHDDAQGYYVPLDFPEPLRDPEGDLAGGRLGSAVQLHAELQRVAAALDMPGDWRAPHPQQPARVAWHALFTQCDVALAHGSLLGFR